MVKKEHYTVSRDRTEKWLESTRAFTRHPELDAGLVKKAALLVMDMQNFFIAGSSHACVPSAKQLVPNINKLISIFTEVNNPVIFTRHALGADDDPGIMAEWWKDTLRDNTEDAEIYAELVIPENAVMLRKTTYDAFHGTELNKILNNHEVRTVVITGVLTHLCCETTARTAFVNNFHVIIVVDASATTSEELHLSALKTLSDGFAVPLTTEMLAHKLLE